MSFGATWKQSKQGLMVSVGSGVSLERDKIAITEATLYTQDNQPKELIAVMPYYNYDGSMMGNVLGVSWGILPIIIFIVVVILLILAIRYSIKTNTPPMAPSKDNACEIARKRYAKGEITKEEYEEICETLGV